MTRESKTIFLVGLVLTAYAVMILVQSGGVVYPYPLNPVIFLAITFQIAFWNRKDKISALLPVFTGVFLVLSSPFLWESFLSLEQLQYIYKTPIIEWSKVLFALSILAWGINTAHEQKTNVFKLLTIIGILSFEIFYLTDFNQGLILSYGIIVTSTVLSSSKKGIDKLWILLLILEITYWITILFNN